MAIPVPTHQRNRDSLFESAFEGASIGMALVGLDGRWLKVNQALCAILGYLEQELLQVDFQTLTHPHDLDADLQLLQDVIAGKINHYHLEKRYFHKQGQEICALLSVSLMKRDDGSPDFFISQVQDITDRKRAEAERDTFFNHSIDMLAIANRDGYLLQVNPAWTAALGWSAQELTQRKFFEYLHPDDKIRTEQELQNVLAGKATPGFANRYRASDGSYRWIEWSTSHHGSGHLYCCARDITERREMQQSIQDSEHLYRSLVSSLSEGVFLANAEGYILACNESAERILGVDRESIIGAHLEHAHWQLSDADDIPLAPENKPTQTALYSGLPVRNVTIGLRTQHQALRWLSVNSQPLYQAGSQQPYAAVTSFDDITAAKLMTEELEKQAHTDFMTGAYNRRYFYEQAAQELARAKRYSKSLSLMLLDVDHFKRINDEHGHHAGDSALIALVNTITAVLRDVDIIGRLGGEEFAILLPETSLQNCLEVAERLRVSISCQRVAISASTSLNFTVSIGIADMLTTDQNMDMMISRADKALYNAKESGRNQVWVGGLILN